ncbi:expressed unknown protein [Seminavis robusta]|uniref:Uncharacterized protein n=1 Tax=Seminavis robusta TaxID=568900 RepID=A0A9N8EUE6_9STRA|nr:expressed unknown protein [Seminavis robusta]|eukprot:Sro1909_g304820.1 n/a (791) ;mRNA; f:10583-12955
MMSSDDAPFKAFATTSVSTHIETGMDIDMMSGFEPPKMTDMKLYDHHQGGEEQLLPLEKHHVILGRYNKGKKVKALTPAVEVYKKVRSQIRRTKYLSSSEVHHIKNSTSLLLQEELELAEQPAVTFWVDVHKAEQAGTGKYQELLQANPQLRYLNDFDGDVVVFVQDHQDYFLKADIDTKRRKCGTAASNSNDNNNNKVVEFSTEASVVSACSTSACSRTTVAHTVSTLGSSPSADHNAAATRTTSPVAIHDDNDKTIQPVVTPPCPAEATAGAPKVRDNFTRKASMEVSVISNCSASTSACDHSAALTVSSLSTHTPQPSFAAFEPKQLFQLEIGAIVDIEAEVDQICCRWICAGPELEVIKRKTTLVEAFVSHVLEYQHVLCGNGSPLLNSPAVELQQLNETLLVQAVNVLGNSMVEWFHKFPSSCLPGEENAWLEQFQQQPQQFASGGPHTRVESDGCLTTMQIDSDIGGMEVGSVGTYDGSEEMQAALSDDDRVTLASHYLSEFSLSSDNPQDRTPTEQWHFTGIVVGEGEQVGERICIADWLGAEEARQGAREGKLLNPKNHQPQLKGLPGTRIRARAEWSPVCRDQEHNRAMQDAEWAPVCRDEEHNRAMQDADQAQKERGTSKVSEARTASQKRLFQRLQSNLRGKTSEKKRTRIDRERRPSRPWTASSPKANRSSRNRSSSPDEGRWEQHAYPDQSAITNEAQLNILFRRLRHNDPTLKQVRIAGDLALAKALELTQALGPNFYHWDLRPVWDKSTNRNEKPSYLVLKQIEPTLWEDSQSSE